VNFKVNFYVFFKLIKVHFLVSELYIRQNALCNDKNRLNMYSINLHWSRRSTATAYINKNCVKFTISPTWSCKSYIFRAGALACIYPSLRELLCMFTNSVDSFSEQFLVLDNFHCVVPGVSRAHLTPW